MFLNIMKICSRLSFSRSTCRYSSERGRGFLPAIRRMCSCRLARILFLVSAAWAFQVLFFAKRCPTWSKTSSNFVTSFFSRSTRRCSAVKGRECFPARRRMCSCRLARILCSVSCFCFRFQQSCFRFHVSLRFQQSCCRFQRSGLLGLEVEEEERV